MGVMDIIHDTFIDLLCASDCCKKESSETVNLRGEVMLYHNIPPTIYKYLLFLSALLHQDVFKCSVRFSIKLFEVRYGSMFGSFRTFKHQIK